MKPVRIITPTGHLGTTPLEKASFERGCAESPDFIIADSGSCRHRARIRWAPTSPPATRSGSATTSRPCCWRRAGSASR